MTTSLPAWQQKLAKGFHAAVMAALREGQGRQVALICELAESAAAVLRSEPNTNFDGPAFLALVHGARKPKAK